MLKKIVIACFVAVAMASNASAAVVTYVLHTPGVV
jgi:hypothetical protein